MEQSQVKSQQIIRAPMSNTLISKYFDNRANIKSLIDISQFQSLSQVFHSGQYNHVVIFVAIDSETQGHWICMFINSGALYYFDSYGDYPLQVLDEMVKRGDDLWNQDKNLLRLIQNSQFKEHFYYNNFQYQQDGGSIQTCGRYVTLVLVLNSIFTKAKQHFDFEKLNQIMLFWKNKYHKTFGQIAVFFVNQI